MWGYMDAENIGSQSAYMKGVSVDTPLFKFRYLKVQGNASNQTTQKRRVNDVIPHREEKRQPSAIKVQYVQAPVIETMGLDPMVSSAAVIHELAYGRQQDTTGLARPDSGYVLSSENVPVRLDLIV
jgi:hypothetical protein